MTQWNLVARATPGIVSTDGLETSFHIAAETEDGVTITDVQAGDAPGWFYVMLATEAGSEDEARERATRRLLEISKGATEWRQNAGVHAFLDEVDDDHDGEIIEIGDIFSIDSAEEGTD